MCLSACLPARPRPLVWGCPQEGSLNACNHPSFPSTPSTVGFLDSMRPALSVILSSISWPAVPRRRTCCQFAASSFVIYSSLLKASGFVSLFSSRRLSLTLLAGSSLWSSLALQTLVSLWLPADLWADSAAPSLPRFFHFPPGTTPLQHQSTPCSLCPPVP